MLVRILKWCSMAVAATAAAAAMPAYGQQSADSTSAASGAPASAPAATAPTPANEADETAALIARANAAAAANAKAAEAAANSHLDPHRVAMAPSAVARKKAGDFGFRAEIYSGKTYFCKEDATLGTRLKSKKCIDADQFEDYAIQLQIARDTMRKDVCQGGRATNSVSPCGGVP